MSQTLFLLIEESRFFSRIFENTEANELSIGFIPEIFRSNHLILAISTPL